MMLFNLPASQVKSMLVKYLSNSKDLPEAYKNDILKKLNQDE